MFYAFFFFFFFFEVIRKRGARVFSGLRVFYILQAPTPLVPPVLFSMGFMFCWTHFPCHFLPSRFSILERSLLLLFFLSNTPTIKKTLRTTPLQSPDRLVPASLTSSTLSSRSISRSPVPPPCVHAQSHIFLLLCADSSRMLFDQHRFMEHVSPN